MANSTIGSLKVFLGLDAAEFDGGLKAARNNLRRVARDMQQVGREISATGAQLSVALTAPLALFGAASVKAASDAEEMGSAFRYVFGAAARDVEAWAKTTGDALGRSTYVLQQQALTFQQLFKQAAPTNHAAAEMSKQFTLLAQDLSSFFNVAENDALQKLRAGLVGEAEPLRAFGVFLTAAAVEARAFEMGLAGASEELTEQDKILARAALILEATKDAQGDAARTADSFANRSIALQAALNELQVTLGKSLLPALTAAAEAASAALNAFNNLSPAAQSTALALAGVAAAIGPLNLAVGAAVGAFASATKAI
ncbi:MAG: phage tail tape measure protein, partial [Phenylobacterium sp.]|nr:phage tail tape measure protein [Phenylobacterium sp.]